VVYRYVLSRKLSELLATFLSTFCSS